MYSRAARRPGKVQCVGDRAQAAHTASAAAFPSATPGALKEMDPAAAEDVIAAEGDAADHAQVRGILRGAPTGCWAPTKRVLLSQAAPCIYLNPDQQVNA